MRKISWLLSTLSEPYKKEIISKTNKYLELDVRINEGPGNIQEEVLAFLSLFGFKGFREEDKRIRAYMEAEAFDEDALKTFIKQFELDSRLSSYTIGNIKEENWNETWESAYDVVEIGSSCYIRAPFHPDKSGFDHSLLIMPKMSFGTGHHASTRLMIEQMVKLDFSGKDVLDIGCGTGILGILAEKMGARNILAVDNYSWACQNTLDNIELNQCQRLEVLQGEVQDLASRTFEIILANINLNVLVDIIPALNKSLRVGGFMMVSGFYDSDFGKIRKVCSGLLEVNEKSIQKEWMVAVYRKAH
jgi:ribosomal protein L11 methyltransferase